MTRLSIDAGPPVAVPLAFLGAVPLWGIVTGLLLAVDGPAALASRWGPSALALVHATTLGVLGNAVAGALLQLLPAAAGVRVHGGRAAAFATFAALQAGTIGLVAGFRSMAPGLLLAGAVLAGCAFALLGACVLPGLLAGREAVHRGIALAVGALLVTAVLGAAMALALAGQATAPSPVRWADAHAAWGLLGGMLALIAAVGQVVLPMFQGVTAQPARRLAAWHGAVILTLVLATTATAYGRPSIAAAAVAGCAAAWSVSLLIRQARAGRRRAGALRLAWTAGGLAMLAASVALVLQAPAPLTGALVLALALPLPVLAMLLEIVAFLGWIDLQRQTPRGVRVPPVQWLLPARERARVLTGLGVAGIAVISAAAVPAWARPAGLLMAVAHAGLLVALLAARRRRLRVLHGHAPR